LNLQTSLDYGFTKGFRFHKLIQIIRQH